MSMPDFMACTRQSLSRGVNMKSTRALLMMLVSLMVGALAVWLAARWVGQQAQENTVRVVVATTTIDAGAPLQTHVLGWANWPKNAVPQGVFNDLKKPLGRVSNTTIYAGEPVLEFKLAPEGSSGGLSATIAPNKRAISLQVNEIVGVAGYIRPGSLVDVMVNSREGNFKPVSKIILEKILVLAAAQDDKRDQTKPKVVGTVTLEVTPEQAEKIDLARNIGTLSLVLRNPLDTSVAVTSGAYREDVFKTGVAQAQEVPLPPPSSSAQVAVTGRETPPTRGVARKPTRSSLSSQPPAASIEVIRGIQKAQVPEEAK